MQSHVPLFCSLRLVVVLTLFLFLSPVRAWAVDFLDDASYEDSEETQVISDPLEPFNRAVFVFNDKAYIWVLDPVATAYSKVLPADIRGCIDNFFYNLGEPIRSVNCLLQGRFKDSGLTLSRFVINTVCGVFGFGDAATREFDIDPISADFGETLSVWGVGDGFYLVVPIVGPNTLTDFSGWLVDIYAMAVYTPFTDDFEASAVSYGVYEINSTSLHLGLYDDMKSMSFDPYVAVRNAYMQMRRKARDHSYNNRWN